MIRYVTAVLLSMACTMAFAGGSATIQHQEGATMTLEYAGDRVRMNSDEVGGYMLMRDGRIYSVSDEGVFDISSMIDMFSDQLMDPADDIGTLHSLKATGRTETIAGVTGEVHIIDYSTQEQRHQSEIVLSGDPRAIDLQQAWTTIASAFGNVDAQSDLEQAIGKRGVLRFGDDFLVTALSSDSPAAARFELPSEPQDMGHAAQAIGEALGGKAERQQQRVERRTDSEIDRATDRAVDKALDRAFGGLFGGR